MKKILITGANSYIGTSFEKYISQWTEAYEVDTLDMTTAEWREKSFAEYDVVFHVAGIAHSDNGKISKEKEELYYSVNTHLTIDTAKKAKAEGVKQFIFMSSAIVYGDSAPIGEEKIITRDTPVSPANCYGDSKVQAENGLKELQDDNFYVVILRPPMIYGKECKGNYRLLSKIALKTPVFPYIENHRSMIYIENFCEFVRLMIKNEEQGVFWPQNKEYSNTSKLVKEISKIHGKNMHIMFGFEMIIKMLSRKISLLNKAFGSCIYDCEMSNYQEEYQKYSLLESIMLSELGVLMSKEK